MNELLKFFTEHWLISWYTFAMMYFALYVSLEAKGPLVTEDKETLFIKPQKRLDGRLHLLATVVIVYLSPGWVGLISTSFLTMGLTFIALSIIFEMIKRVEQGKSL